MGTEHTVSFDMRLRLFLFCHDAWSAMETIGESIGTEHTVSETKCSVPNVSETKCSVPNVSPNVSLPLTDLGRPIKRM